jgi:hypothetical protein
MSDEWCAAHVNASAARCFQDQKHVADNERKAVADKEQQGVASNVSRQND